MVRSKGEHFTRGELDTLHAAFLARRSAYLVAGEIGCTPRTVHRWFARFRGERPKRRPPIKKLVLTTPPKPPVDRGPRFYKSNFEL